VWGNVYASGLAKYELNVNVGHLHEMCKNFACFSAGLLKELSGIRLYYS